MFLCFKRIHGPEEGTVRMKSSNSHSHTESCTSWNDHSVVVDHYKRHKEG